MAKRFTWILCECWMWCLLCFCSHACMFIYVFLSATFFAHTMFITACLMACVSDSIFLQMLAAWNDEISLHDGSDSGKYSLNNNVSFLDLFQRTNERLVLIIIFFLWIWIIWLMRYHATKGKPVCQSIYQSFIWNCTQNKTYQQWLNRKANAKCDIEIASCNNLCQSFE